MTNAITTSVIICKAKTIKHCVYFETGVKIPYCISDIF